jgi:phosphate transport system protein
MRLHEELGDLELELQAQTGRVLFVLDQVLHALARHDDELADIVIALDDEVDDGYLEIEKSIQSLLARRTPVAIDLRLVLAAVHINLHLERIADYCVTIAKLVKVSDDLDASEPVLDSLESMGRRAEEMTRVALDALCFRDLEAARSLRDLDDLIDQANRHAVLEQLAAAADPGTREWLAHMMLVSRSLERIGDHAVDIGEQTEYVITGQFRESSRSGGD